MNPKIMDKMKSCYLLIAAFTAMMLVGCGEDKQKELCDFSPAVDLTEVVQAYEWYNNYQGEDKDSLLQAKLLNDLPDPEEVTWLLSDTSFVVHLPQYAQSTHPFLSFAEDFYNSLLLGWNLWTNEEIWFHSVVGDGVCDTEDIVASTSGISLDFLKNTDIKRAAQLYQNSMVHYMLDDNMLQEEEEPHLPFMLLEAYNDTIDAKVYKFYQNPELFADTLDSVFNLLSELAKEKISKYTEADTEQQLKVMLTELNSCKNFDEQCALWCNWTNNPNSISENFWILAVGKRLMDSGIYHPQINKIWFIFRTLCQSEFFGLSRTSIIPSDYYNTYRRKCYKTCLKRIEQHPDDVIAMYCAYSIAGRVNVIRFGQNYFGNDAMIEAVALMPGRYGAMDEGEDSEEEGFEVDTDETAEPIE